MIVRKGGTSVLTAKELMHLEDFLGLEQASVNTMNYFANQIQCQQSKQLFQQIAKKNQQNFQTISKHLSAGQTLQ